MQKGMALPTKMCDSLLASRSFSPTLQDHHQSNAVNWAKTLVDVSIIAALTLVPCFLGGRFIGGKVIFFASLLPGALAATYLSLSESHRLFQPHLIAMALWFLAIPLVQLVPLPPSLLSTISPEITSFTYDELQTSHWRPLSLVPSATQDALTLRCAYVLFFAMLYIRIDNFRTAEFFIGFIAIAMVVLTIVSLLQTQFGNGRFLWIYEHPFRSPGSVLRGPYQNQNHLAQMLTLGSASLLYWVWSDRKSSSHPRLSTRRPAKLLEQLLFYLGSPLCIRAFASLGVALVVSSSLATGSRGGLLVVLLTFATFTTLQGVLWLYRQTNKYESPLLRYLPAMILSLFVASLGVTLGLLLRNAKTLGYWRYRIWSADLDIWKRFPWIGTGEGTHGYVYSSAFNEYFPQPFTHAESSLIELLLETGIVGLIVVLLPVFFVIYQLIRNLFYWPLKNAKKTALLAVLVGVLVSLCHATCDFIWHIPSCVIYAIAMGTIGLKITSFDESQVGTETLTLSPPVPRHARYQSNAELWLTAGLTVTVPLLTWKSLPAARASLLWDQVAREEGQSPKNALPIAADAVDAQKIRYQEILRIDPNDHRAASRIALIMAEKARVISKHQGQTIHREESLRYALRSIQTCPLDSNAFLAAAIALGNSNLSQREKLLKHALRLNRCDSRIYLEFGKFQLSQGRLEPAVSSLRQAMLLDPENRRATLSVLVNAIPADLLLNSLRPNQEITDRLYEIYQSLDRPDDAQKAGDRLVAMLCQTKGSIPPDTGDFLKAYSIATEIQSNTLRTMVAELAVATTPDSWTHRFLLAKCLYQQRDYHQALPHLQWCHNRRPLTPNLQSMLKRAVNAVRTELDSPKMAEQSWHGRSQLIPLE